MTISKLTLKDFQCHERLTIRFSPTVTTLIGPNDAGKSAIIRALRFIAANQPSGLGFVRRSNSKLSRNLKANLTVDGHTVKRIRGERTNTYRLDGRRFAAFGRGKVPDEVDKLLNISEVNFQRQMETPFWFSDSAGQVSKKLNQIINLDAIDNSLEFIGKKVRTAKSEIAVSRERLKSIKIEIARAKWIRKCEMDLAELEAAKERHSDIVLNRSRLAILVQTARKSRQREIESVRIAGEIGRVVRLGERAEKRQESARTLTDLIEKAKKYKRLVKKTTTEFLADFDSLLEVNGEMFKYAEDRRALDYLVAELKEAETCAIEKKRSLRTSEKSLLKYAKKRCPVCGRKYE